MNKEEWISRHRLFMYHELDTSELDIRWYGDTAAGAHWLVFPGGYWVHRPLCLPLLVTAHGETERVRIGVGAACPGQEPPPEPSRG